MTAPNLFNKSHSGMAPFRRLAAMLLGCAFAIPLQAQPPADTTNAQRPQLVIEAGHKKPIADSAISPDGRWAASYSSQDGEIKIWDAQTGALARTIQGPPEGRDLRFAPTGKTINLDYRWKESGLRTASYDTGTGSPYATPPLACLQDELLFATAPDGQTILCARNYSGSGGRNEIDLHIRSAQSDHPLTAPQFKYFMRITPVFSPDGRLLVAQYHLEPMNDAVQIWEVATGKLLRELPDRQFLSFSPDGQLIALGRLGAYPTPGQRKRLTPIERLGGIELWDARSVTHQSEFTGRSFIGFALNGQAVLMTYGARASYLPPQMELWNARQRALQPIRKIDIEGGDPVLSPDGRFVVLGPSKSAPPPPPAPPRDGRSANSQVETKGAKEIEPIILFDLQNGEVRRVRSEHKLPISHIAFSGDGSAFITTDTHGQAIIWDIQSGKIKANLEDVIVDGHLSVSAGGQAAVTSGANILHFDTGKFIKTVFNPGHFRGAFSTDDQSLLLTTGSPLSPEPLFQWDLKTLQLKSPTKKEDGDVASGKLLWKNKQWPSEISHNGKLVVSVNDSNQVEIREAPGGRLLVTLAIITSDPRQLSATDWIAFTPEGYYTASPGAARYIRWRVDGKLLPAETYAKEFNRPDLVSKAISVAR